MTTAENTAVNTAVTGERADILACLAKARHFLLHPSQGLTDEQANTRSTVSALTVGGLVKHVADVEKGWAAFAATGRHGSEDAWADSPEEFTPELVASWEANFRLADGETLDGVRAAYVEVAAATDELVRTLDLDTAYELPAAPWQPPGEFWTVRRVFLHLIAEIAQHSGHADIIRETIDGQKSMG